MKKKNSILFLFCLTAVFAALFSGCVKVEVSDTKTDSDEQNVSFSELILSRRSIRSYQPQPVEREKMEEIVKCGIYAPSALNRQSWEVRIVDNPEFINGVTELFKKENPAAADNPNFKNMFVNAQSAVYRLTFSKEAERGVFSGSATVFWQRILRFDLTFAPDGETLPFPSVRF